MVLCLKKKFKNIVTNYGFMTKKKKKKTKGKKSLAT